MPFLRRTLVVAALLLAPALAHAQDASAADIETARAAFLQGLDLRDKQHNLASSIERFKAAYALVPTPRIGFELGKTLRATGDFVGARAAFVAATQLPVRRTESAEAKKAREDADAQANDLEPRIPQLLIRLRGEGQVVIDGQAIRHDALAVPRRLNPGNHVVQVQVEGDVRSEQSIVLREGQHEEMSLTTEAGGIPVPQGHGNYTPPQPTPTYNNPPPNNPPPVFQPPILHSNAGTKSALFYTSYALVGAGVATGVIALSFLKSATDACDASHICGPDYASNKGPAIGFAVATDALWGVALICFIVGVAIPRESEEPIQVGFTPQNGGGFLSAVGRF